MRKRSCAGGRHVKVAGLNGTVIVDADLDKVRLPTMDHRDHPGLNNATGHIGLVAHGDGEKMLFRNLRVKELRRAASLSRVDHEHRVVGDAEQRVVGALQLAGGVAARIPDQADAQAPGFFRLAAQRAVLVGDQVVEVGLHGPGARQRHDQVGADHPVALAAESRPEPRAAATADGPAVVEGEQVGGIESDVGLVGNGAQAVLHAEGSPEADLRQVGIRPGNLRAELAQIDVPVVVAVVEIVVDEAPLPPAAGRRPAEEAGGQKPLVAVLGSRNRHLVAFDVALHGPKSHLVGNRAALADRARPVDALVEAEIAVDALVDRALEALHAGEQRQVLVPGSSQASAHSHTEQPPHGSQPPHEPQPTPHPPPGPHVAQSSGPTSYPSGPIGSPSGSNPISSTTGSAESSMTGPMALVAETIWMGPCACPCACQAPAGARLPPSTRCCQLLRSEGWFTLAPPNWICAQQSCPPTASQQHAATAKRREIPAGFMMYPSKERSSREPIPARRQPQHRLHREFANRFFR